MLGERVDGWMADVKTQRVSLPFMLACIVVIAALLSVPFQTFGNSAYADVRKADVVMGKTVEEQELSVAQCPSIDAERAILVDKNGTVYFSRNGGEPAQIASITKVMTAIVAIENAPQSTYVAVSARAAYVGESSAGLQEGDVMDFESALKALLVPSGNDAAIAIAETVGGIMMAADPSLGDDAMQVFIDAMNKKAQELGCEDTLYENPHGLDFDEWAGNVHSTAADQAKVAKCAMSYELIRTIVGGGSTSIAVTRDGGREIIELETTDELLDMYEYAIGVKTGLTDLAGYCFMGAANKDGRELYAVVLDSADEYQRFRDSKILFEWAYEHCFELKLANSKMTTTYTVNGEKREVPVVAEVAHLDWTDKTVKATLANPDATISVFDLDGNVSQSFKFDDVHGNVKSGQKVGSVVYKQRNNVVAEQNLIAVEDVDAPGLIDGLGIWWTRFLGGFSGAPEAASSSVYNVMPIINSNVSSAA